jgi:hypothetical protein
MHDSGDIAEQGEKDIEPERAPDANLQKHPQRGKKDGAQYSNQIHGSLLF